MRLKAVQIFLCKFENLWKLVLVSNICIKRKENKDILNTYFADLLFEGGNIDAKLSFLKSWSLSFSMV